ncbi:hypothetical protein [Candidatus Poseidonia alphae]|uniref:hypothetical protein n=1 Tax=Candidatus Poseidonia alphae TaxID=1915863 RepID=UPI0030C6E302
MNEITFPSILLKKKGLVDIIEREREKREQSRLKLQSIAQNKLKNKISKLMKTHRFDKEIKKAAKAGKNSIDVKFRKKYVLNCDLSEPFIEISNKKRELSVSITFNQYIKSIEDHLFEEENIQGEVLIERDDDSHLTSISGVHIEWSSLTPLPLTLDFIWNPSVLIDEVTEDETFTELFARMGYLPRDGTRLVLKKGRRRVSQQQKVSSFFGTTLTVRPEHYNGMEEAFEL